MKLSKPDLKEEVKVIRVAVLTAMAEASIHYLPTKRLAVTLLD